MMASVQYQTLRRAGTSPGCIVVYMFPRVQRKIRTAVSQSGRFPCCMAKRAFFLCLLHGSPSLLLHYGKRSFVRTSKHSAPWRLLGCLL